MKKLLLVASLILTLVFGAWGPFGHIEIGRKVAQEMGIPREYWPVFIFGGLAPDLPLAYGPGGDNDKMQALFHSKAYSDALRSLARTPSQIWWTKGFLVHVWAEDPVESAYTNKMMALGAPFGADFAVDGLLVAWGAFPYGYKIGITWEIRSLILNAWNLAGFPKFNGMPDALWVDGAVGNINFYLGIAYLYPAFFWSLVPPIDQARIWYGDYSFYLTKSVDAAVILLRNYTPGATPAPTVTPYPWNRPTPRPWR